MKFSETYFKRANENLAPKNLKNKAKIPKTSTKKIAKNLITCLKFFI